MSNNKEIERADLHKTIWRIANDLRSSVDEGTSRPTRLAIVLPFHFGKPDQLPQIDRDMANQLATENKDIPEYLKLLKQLYHTGEVRLYDWDVPQESE